MTEQRLINVLKEVFSLPVDNWSKSALEKNLFSRAISTATEDSSESELFRAREYLLEEEEKSKKEVFRLWNNSQKSIGIEFDNFYDGCIEGILSMQRSIEHVEQVNRIGSEIEQMLLELKDVRGNIVQYEKELQSSRLEKEFEDTLKTLANLNYFAKGEVDESLSMHIEKLDLLKNILINLKEIEKANSFQNRGISINLSGKLEIAYEQEIARFSNILENFVADLFQIVKPSEKQLSLVISKSDDSLTLILKTCRLYSFQHIVQSRLEQAVIKIIKPLLSLDMKLSILDDSMIGLEKTDSIPNTVDCGLLDKLFDSYFRIGKYLSQKITDEDVKEYLKNVMFEMQKTRFDLLLDNAVPLSLSELNSYDEWLNLKISADEFSVLKPRFERMKKELYSIYLMKKGQMQLTETKRILQENKIDSVIMPEKNLKDSTIKTELDEYFGKIRGHLENTGNKLIDTQTILTSFPTSRINSSSKAFVALIQKMFVDMKELPNKLWDTALASLVECVSYYRLITLRTIDKNGLDKIPQQIVLVHNDFMFILFALVEQCADMNEIGLLQNGILSEELNQLLIDGRKIFLKAIQVQIDDVKRLLQDCKRCLSRTLFEEAREDLERYFKQVKHQINTLVKLWRPVLCWSNYLFAIGKIMDTFFKLLAETILYLDDLEEMECGWLCNFIYQQDDEHGILKQLDKIFRREIEMIANMKQLDRDELLTEMLPKSAKTLEAVMFVLDNNMAHTMEKFKEGYFSEAGLKMPQDLVRLLRKVFADSDRRRDAIQEISSTNHL